MARILIVYYSRSNATRTLAAELAKELGSDMVAIQDRQPRAGTRGFLRSLWEASRSILPEIEPPHITLSSYDLVMLGTPVWAAHAACPMRRFLHNNAHLLPATAYFCTYGGRGYRTAFRDMRALTGKPPLATLAVRRHDLLHAHYANRLNRFMARLAPASHRHPLNA